MKVTSLAEKRALDTNDCMKWSARDLLSHYLNRIDEGEEFSGMAVLYVQKLPGQVCTGMRRAQLSTLEVIGALEAVKYDLLVAEEE